MDTGTCIPHFTMYLTSEYLDENYTTTTQQLRKIKKITTRCTPTLYAQGISPAMVPKTKFSMAN